VYADISFKTATLPNHHGRWPQAASVGDFRHRLATVQMGIAAADQRVGSDLAATRLLKLLLLYKNRIST